MSITTLGIIIIVLPITIIQSYGPLSSYNGQSALGSFVRLDLLNILRISLEMARPRPNQEEYLAALSLVKFINSSRSDEYLSAFYPMNHYSSATKFLIFLNGILYNVDPDSNIWRASKIITKMITTKTNPNAVNNRRRLVNTWSKRRRMERIQDRYGKRAGKTVIDPRYCHNLDSQKLDYMKLFINCKLFDLSQFFKNLFKPNDKNRKDYILYLRSIPMRHLESWL